MMSCLAGIALQAAFLLASQQAGPKEALIEKSEAPPGGRALGTRAYAAKEKEAPFLKKVTEKAVSFRPDVNVPKPSNMTDSKWGLIQGQLEKERSQRIPQEKYQLADQAGQYVGWFGILREESWDEKTRLTTLVVEHKYFDGMVDLHQQVVSLHGAGDFTATLGKKGTGIPPLALVRVYGTVARDRNGSPAVAAEYIRYWDWGLFAFMNYGKDKGNPRWVQLRKVPADKAYNAVPTTPYYEERLGKRETPK